MGANTRDAPDLTGLLAGRDLRGTSPLVKGAPNDAGPVVLGDLYFEEVGLSDLGQIGTAEALGSPAIGAVLGLGGVGSLEAFGAPGVGAAVAPDSISSAEAFGVPAVGSVPHELIDLGGIASAEAFGVPAVGEQAPPVAPPASGVHGGGWYYRLDAKDELEELLFEQHNMVVALVAEGELA